MSAPNTPNTDYQPLSFDQAIQFYWDPPSDPTVTEYRLTLNYSGGSLVYTITAPARTYKATGLTNGLTYSATLEARNATDYSIPGTYRDWQAGAPPNTPATATASYVGTNSALVSWTAGAPVNAQVFWYVIETQSTNPNDTIYRYSANGLTQSNFFIDNILNSNSTYSFNVYAVNCPDYSIALSTNSVSYGFPYLPSYVSGNFLWMDAADPTTLTTSGTTVTQWRDKSQFYYTTTTAGGTTSLLTGGLNGSNVLGFSSSYLFAPIAPAWNGERMTALMVGVLSNVNNSPRFLSAGRCNVNDTIDSSVAILFYRNTSGARISTYRSNAYYETALSAYDTPFLGSAVLTTGQIQQALNGSNPGTSNGTNSSLFNVSMISMGCGPNSANTGEYLTGRIAEMLLFNIDLDPFTRQKMEGYLSWKWGIQSLLPQTHPFYLFAPTDKTVFSPTMFSGMRFWYDAQDSGTIIRTLSSVTQWNDKSSNAFHMRRIGASTITYNATAVNNYPALYFSSFAGMSTNAYTLSATSQLSFFIVLNQIGQMATGVNAEIFANSANYQVLDLFTRGTSPTDVRLVLGSGIENSTGSNITGGNTLLNFTTAGAGASASIYINGNTALTFTSGNSAPMTSSQPYQLVSSRWIGNICEVMAYSNALSTGDRQTVEGYLAWKWGLQVNLPDTHPYKYMNPSSNYTTSNYVPQNLLLRFTATSATSGSSQWPNQSPLYSTTYNASIENPSGGTITKNTDGNGVVFNGSTNYRFPPTGNAFGTKTRWTISTWFKRTGSVEGGTIVTNVYAGASINMYIIGDTATSMVGGYFVPGTFYQGNSYTFALNTWTHMCVTFNGSAITTYINGNLYGSVAQSVTPGSSGSYYRIGRKWDAASYINGELGEVIVYDRALYSSEVLQNYQNTYATYLTSTPILKYTASTWNATGSWPNTGSLGAGTGSIYNAALNSGSRTKNGAGNGVVLNGSTSYVFTAVDLGSSYTVIFWFKRTAANNVGSVIFGQPNGGGGDTRTMINIISNTSRNTGSQPLLVASSSEFAFYSQEKFDCTGPSSSFPLNTWQMMAITVNKVTAAAEYGNVIRNYINGSFQINTTPQLANGYFYGGSLYIGSLSAGANTGVVGELAVYTRILNPNELQQYYQSTRSTYGV